MEMVEKLALDHAKKVMVEWSQLESILKANGMTKDEIHLVKISFDKAGNGAA